MTKTVLLILLLIGQTGEWATPELGIGIYEPKPTDCRFVLVYDCPKEDEMMDKPIEKITKWLLEHDNEIVCLHPEKKIAVEIIACINEGYMLVKKGDTATICPDCGMVKIIESCCGSCDKEEKDET